MSETVKPKNNIKCKQCKDTIELSIYPWSVWDTKKDKSKSIAGYACKSCSGHWWIPWQDETRTWSYQDMYWLTIVDCSIKAA